ncbi:MAG: hypothetical protein P0Y49_04805 [Candidatus Pedobacter colombiensis]|uniref:Uncharacterized protein n=1 Tax=Candidatus Pedobacter colombiensis TaxID=3121371 RepID=A0AAJ5WB79_9SPHI|nr:hypothetical protein [Pedobacter sp.]WEK20456.1 MAG: hypothetical protein P0Y49_04805 [Pedobacter sp.]
MQLFKNFGGTVQSFSEISGHDFTDQQTDRIKEEIQSKGKEYILGVNDQEFKEYLIAKYSMDPLTIHLDTETVEQPKVSKEILEDRMYREKYETEVYTFTATYQFSGSGILFTIRPSTWTMTSTEIYVVQNSGLVSFKFKLYKKDPAEFEREKNSKRSKAFTNLANANSFVNSYNQSISSYVETAFTTEKNKYLSENDFFAAINIKVNNDTISVFTPPTIEKKVIPQPQVSLQKEFASEPTMAKGMYEDILKVIYDSGKSMEKKPALYSGKDEEGLRDQFLFVLETRYEGTTASGETFNRGGKTDIILKYANDGSNLFVAECKVWHGSSEFLKAISQLFDNYLTWRDSKAALILFVNNKDFSNVLSTIRTDVVNHPYFVKEKGVRGESSFSYIFHLPQDMSKPVLFEIMAFHYDK